MKNKILALLLALCMVLSLMPVLAFASGNEGNEQGGGTDPVQTEAPDPGETTDPEPDKTTDPAPGETTDPAPGETTDPNPAQTRDPDPTVSQPGTAGNGSGTGNGEEDLDEHHCQCTAPGCTAPGHVGGEDGSVCVVVVSDGSLCAACKAYADGEPAAPSAEPSAAPSAAPSTQPANPGAPQRAEDFSDIQPGMWYNDDVTTMVQKGWFIGQAGGKFAPADPTTGAEVVVILSRVLGYDLVTTGSAWSAEATAWAADHGLSEGITITTSGSLARQDLILMLWRAADKPDSSYALDFTDIGGVSGDALTALRWAVEKGIVKGNGDGTVSPGGPTKRCEMAALMVRYDAAVNG